MAAPNTPYVDGWLGPEREISVIPKPQFPFRNNPTPDTYSRAYERMYYAEPRLFIPKVANRTAWTNLLTYSEQLDNAAWTKTNLTVTANVGTAPDGQATLDKLLETVTNGEHSATQAATVTAAATEVSVFAVGGLTRLWIRLAFIDSAATTFSAFFNIASGYIGTKSAGVTAKIVALGNGQFRCVIQFTPAAGAGTFKANVSTDGTTISYAGTTTVGVYLWGAEVATGTETPYISTTTVARAISAPDRDKVDPMAYLIEEDDPNIETSSNGIARRVFSRIPNDQNVPGSMFVTKPDVPGTFPQVFGSYRLFQPVTTVAAYDSYFAQTVTSDTGAPSVYPTAGTYTLTLGANTTGAIAYNAAAATVQTALNAITTVSNRGNLVVGGAYNTGGGLTIAFNDYAAAALNLGSLTLYDDATAASLVSATNGGYSQSAGISINETYLGVMTANTASLTVSIGVVASNFLTSSTQRIAGTIQATTGQFTGGTFTLTVFGQTTGAIAYSGTIATLIANIQSALTALSEVVDRGGCTVNDTGSNMATSNNLIAFEVIFPPRRFTGGTFTITIFGQTTGAIAYNATAATVKTALDALSEIVNRGYSTVTIPSGQTTILTANSTQINFTIGFANDVFIANSGALTPAPAYATPSITDSAIGRLQKIVFSSSAAVRDIYVASHGFVLTDTLYVKGGSTYYPGITVFTLPDSNTVRFQISGSADYVSASTITEAGKRTVASYKPGSALTRINRVTAFYLPGVTAGITTAADIPLPTYQGDPTTLLTAIFAQSTSINYQVGDLEQWRGPILLRTVTTINATQL